MNFFDDKTLKKIDGKENKYDRYLVQDKDLIISECIQSIDVMSIILSSSLTIAMRPKTITLLTFSAHSPSFLYPESYTQKETLLLLDIASTLCPFFPL